MTCPIPWGGHNDGCNIHAVCTICMNSLRVMKRAENFASYFLYVLPVAVARSSSDDNVIMLRISVLWISSCFHMRCMTRRLGWQQRTNPTPGPRHSWPLYHQLKDSVFSGPYSGETIDRILKDREVQKL